MSSGDDDYGNTSRDPFAKWDDRFLSVAAIVASWSKDPSTKAGCVLVRPDKSIASLGYNGFPMGCSDSTEKYEDRETKYARVIHAEMNALMFCRDPIPLVGFTLYTTAPSCPRCAAHMIQAGIRRFVWWDVDNETYKRWDLDRTYRILGEVGAAWNVKEPRP